MIREGDNARALPISELAFEEIAPFDSPDSGIDGAALV
jgi:hypothetical protein